MKWSGSVMFHSLQPHELYVACQAPPPMAFSRQEYHKIEHKWERYIYILYIYYIYIWSLKGSVQFSLSRVWLFATPWTAAHQASLSTTNSWSLFKVMSIESVRPSNHLILCRPLLLPPSIFPSTRVFSNELVLRIRWPKYWSFSFDISPSNEHSGLISFRWTGWIKRL